MSSTHSLLVVEDERTLRRLLEYRLDGHYDVRTAADGLEALEYVQERPPDLIVSDIMMPHMDGFALQEALQQDKDTRVIPFIFLTAKADDRSRLKGMRTGVDDYITKPFDTEQLLVRIRRLLERTETFRESLNAKLGRNFSEKLMPHAMPEVEGHRVFFASKPRRQGGGDLFDWTEPEEGTFFFIVGDVMGKGVEAKFYAFSFLSYVRGTLHAMLRETTSPADLMRRLNQLICDDQLLEDTFTSLLIVRWHAPTGQVTYANAGHCRPLLLTREQSRVVEHSDLVLGLEKNTGFEDASFTLEGDDALVLYTDGLTEQRLKSGRMIGEQGVLQIAETVRTVDAPVEKMLRAIRQNSQEETFDDDILVFWLQRWAEG